MKLTEEQQRAIGGVRVEDGAVIISINGGAKYRNSNARQLCCDLITALNAPPAIDDQTANCTATIRMNAVPDFVKLGDLFPISICSADSDVARSVNCPVVAIDGTSFTVQLPPAG